MGIFQARVDDKGRLKLPAHVFEYLKALAVDKVFITTFDMKLARIYPKKVWESNQNLFASAGELAQSAQDLAFVANLFGGESEIDAQGRLLMPSELRRKMELEAAPVWLDYYNGRINVFGKKVYEERMQRAMVGLEDKLKALESKGLK